jgi:hypothetical protein
MKAIKDFILKCKFCGFVIMGTSYEPILLHIRNKHKGNEINDFGNVVNCYPYFEQIGTFNITERLK